MSKFSEEEAKIEVLNRAKTFMKDMNSLIDKIEADLNSENSNAQMNGILHSMAFSECLKQYSHHLQELFKEFVAVNEKTTSN